MHTITTRPQLYSKHQYALVFLLLVGWLLFAFTPLIHAVAPAQGYQYVRLVITDNTGGTRPYEIEWLNGSVVYPKQAMSTNNDIEVSIINDEVRDAYLMFDKDPDTGPYIRDLNDGETTVDMKFAYPVYLTGVRIDRKHTWASIPPFRVEATNDPAAGWTTVYTSPNPIDGSGQTVMTFDFGTDPVSVDTTPPSTPSVNVAQITQNSVTLSWPTSTDNSGSIAGYKVFFDGEYQGFSTSTSFTQSYTLTPNTTYEATVIAYDAQYNDSPLATTNFTTTSRPNAQSYAYLRFYINETNSDSDRLSLKEFNWLMDDRAFPVERLINAAGSEDIEITSDDNIYNFDGPYKAFDDDSTSHWYGSEGQHVTLHFKNIDIYPTGVEMVLSRWDQYKDVRFEGSDDGQNWTLLYERTNLAFDAYPTIGENYRIGRFDFGTKLPNNVDTTPPTVPDGLSVIQATSTFAQIRWNASNDSGTGVNLYKIFVNGQEWSSTTIAEATVYALSPQTNYDIRVVAVDRLANESAASSSLTVSTSALQPTVGAMTVATGLGSETEGIWKENIDFATEWANYATANPFNPVFLDEISDYKVLRFMDMLPTNNNWIENWADRRQPNDPDQKVYQNYDKTNVESRLGMAIEWMIKLCNLTGADLWINVPHAANDNYIQQLAALTKQYLDPALNVYIEYSNEVWGGFAAETYTNDQGFALGFDQGSFPRYAWFQDDEYARFRYYVHRSAQIFAIFNQVFSGQTSRVQKVLSGWNGQPDVTRVHLDALADNEINPQSIYPDHYAIAPYFGIGAPVTGTDDEALATLLGLVNASVENVQKHYAIIADRGLNIPLVTYEAGQHITVAGELINRNPVMYQAYIEYMNALAPYIDVFTQFVYMAPYGRGMAWGAKEYVGQPNIEAYKYRAIADWQAVNANNSPLQAPTIIEQPLSITVGEGSGVNITPVVVGQQSISYQWYENGSPITDATQSELQIPQVSFSANGNSYSFVATNTYGSVSSQPITLTVEEVEKALVDKVSAAVTVDGSAENLWDQTTAYTLENVNGGTVDGASDLSASFKVLWDDAYLYLLVEVTDNTLVAVEDPATPWEYDGIEVYLDATNDKTEGYNTNDRQVVYNYQSNSLVGASGVMPIGNALAAQSVTASGYRMELAFAWADMGVTPTTGHYLGLDIMVADNDTPGGSREGKLAWWATEDRSWERPANFGTALLQGENTQPGSNFPDPNVWYTFQNKAYDLPLKSFNGSNGYDARLHNSNSYHQNRQWKFVSEGNGWYRIMNRAYPARPLSSLTNSDKYDVRLYEGNDTNDNQLWKLVEDPVGSGHYKIINKAYNLPMKSYNAKNNYDARLHTKNNSNDNRRWELFSTTNARTASSDKGAVSNVVTTDESRVENEVLLFPNPASDILEIRLSNQEGEVTITLTDMLGRTVIRHHQRTSQSVSLPVYTLPKGLYHVNVWQAEQNTLRKLLIE